VTGSVCIKCLWRLEEKGGGQLGGGGEKGCYRRKILALGALE